MTGIGLTVTSIASLTVQDPCVTVTLYVPELPTDSVALLAPVLQA